MPILKIKNENGEWVRLPYVIKIIQGGNVITELTEEQIKAINEMECTMNENGELSVIYDETILDLDFQIEDGNLIVYNNINATFSINENGELEVNYE